MPEKESVTEDNAVKEDSREMYDDLPDTATDEESEDYSEEEEADSSRDVPDITEKNTGHKEIDRHKSIVRL